MMGVRHGRWPSHLPRVLLAAGDETHMPPTTATAASPAHPPPPPPPPPRTPTFRPSMAVIVGVLTTMFSLTFLLLLYAKHCRRTGGAGRPYPGRGGGGGGEQRHSGVDRGVVESLPAFRFGALRGVGRRKEGMECAVCLCRFEEEELLRLLPKCRHAFHADCVDTWLDAHSTCPLCRLRVNPEDVLLSLHHYEPLAGPRPHPSDPSPTAPSSSSSRLGFLRPGRVSGRHSSAGEKRSATPTAAAAHQVFVQMPGSHDPRSMRRSADSALLVAGAAHQVFVQMPGSNGPPPGPRLSADNVLLAANAAAKVPAGRKDGLLLADEEAAATAAASAHRVVVSGDGEPEGGARRWSDTRPQDLLLRREMVPGGSSSATSGAAAAMTSRSASEITWVARFAGGGAAAAKRATRWPGRRGEGHVASG